MRPSNEEAASVFGPLGGRYVINEPLQIAGD
jgi:hypothetical protein